MIIRNFRAAAWRKEKRKRKKKKEKRKKKRKEAQDTKKGPVHQPAHISFLACCLTYLLPVALSKSSTSIPAPQPLPLSA